MLLKVIRHTWQENLFLEKYLLGLSKLQFTNI